MKGKSKFDPKKLDKMNIGSRQYSDQFDRLKFTEQVKT